MELTSKRSTEEIFSQTFQFLQTSWPTGCDRVLGTQVQQQPELEKAPLETEQVQLELEKPPPLASEQVPLQSEPEKPSLETKQEVQLQPEPEKSPLETEEVQLQSEPVKPSFETEQVQLQSESEKPALETKQVQLQSEPEKPPLESEQASVTQTCPSCGAATAPQWHFCRRCGAPLKQGMEEVAAREPDANGMGNVERALADADPASVKRVALQMFGQLTPADYARVQTRLEDAASKLVPAASGAEGTTSHARAEVLQRPRAGLAELRIWLGFMKLDERLPKPEAVNKLLYGEEESSAKGADVIALFVTDLLIDKESAKTLRQLLRGSMGEDNAKDYIFNEDDAGLLVRHIPAQLVKATESGSRYVAMFVAVRRRYVFDSDEDQDVDHYDCFPEPGYLSCKSARRNDYSPTFKSIMTQSVILNIDGEKLDLLLLGANLDTNDEAKLGQLESLERMLRMQQRGRPNFCAVIWGDFNNRLVAFEEMAPYVKEKKKGKYEITDAGAKFLVDWFKQPARRHELLSKDALHYRGRDLAGNEVEPPACNLKLRQMFHMTSDVPADFELPLPSYKQQPLDDVLSGILETPIKLEETACLDTIKPFEIGRIRTDVMDTYFGWSKLQRQIRAEDPSTPGGTSNYYLQLGWLDGVGIWRNSTTEAKLTEWDTEWNVRAFDHLPMRSVVTVAAGRGTMLKVWLGFVKLDERLPTPESVHKLLYGNTTASAEDADVVALFFTDLLISAESVECLRHLLRSSMGEERAANYIFNADDSDLLLAHIPAQLVKAEEKGSRYVGMYVAVKKQYVTDSDKDGGDLDHHDCFPDPCYLSCKSGRRNEYAPTFKSVLNQMVLLHVDGEYLHLLLLGANLDTNDEAKLCQLDSLKRVLNSQSHGKPNFCALLWGDFNNRLVAFDELKPPYVTKDAKGKFEITDEGAQYLMQQFLDPGLRRQLLQKDVLVYDGLDLAGQKFVQPECCKRMVEMFTMGVHSDVSIPMPSYKVQPLGEIMGKQLGCQLTLKEVVCLNKIAAVDLALLWNSQVAQYDIPEWHHLQKLRPSDQEVEDPRQDLVHVFFGWKENGKYLQRVIRSEPASSENGPPNLYMQLGWLDGVGRWKGNTIGSELLAWDTEPRVQAFDHVPLRALLKLSI
eukprot:TRINITY_DN105705_c0_g1_i1.p1 TRINITY_DN105705_c0_g1~~TRINITY_DN105705_c0_g1_i1.p1  ORF type:complete len:1136 (+),score=244.28 TRINITY_DN105705_c0_g1_i1:99-3506(+)